MVRGPVPGAPEKVRLWWRRLGKLDEPDLGGASNSPHAPNWAWPAPNLTTKVTCPAQLNSPSPTPNERNAIKPARPLVSSFQPGQEPEGKCTIALPGPTEPATQRSSFCVSRGADERLHRPCVAIDEARRSATGLN